MGVSYATLTRMRPHSFADAAGQLAKSATGLHHAQHGYDHHVVRPLRAKHGWRGGGQPDASVVAQVDGLAIATLRLRVLTGKVALVALAAGMAVAQQQLEGVVGKVKSAGMTVGDDGSVAANPWGDAGAAATLSRVSTEYENEIKKVLAFATHVDGACAAALRRSDDLPVSTQNASPGILKQALDDYGNAAGDLASATDLLLDTIERSAALTAELSGRGGASFVEAWHAATPEQRQELLIAALSLDASIGLIATGVLMEVGGVALDISGAFSFGAGTVAGIAVHVAGADVIGAGAAGTLASGAVLAREINELYQLTERKHSWNRPPLPQRPAAKPPQVSDGKLRNIVKDLYLRPGARGPWAGDGTTADALRSEFRTGDSTKLRWHTEKACRALAALQDWISAHPGASVADKAVAEMERETLIEALAGG